jgi:hypothetical protein
MSYSKDVILYPELSIDDWSVVNKRKSNPKGLSIMDNTDLETMDTQVENKQNITHNTDNYKD